MNKTTNYNLNLPEVGEFYDVNLVNENTNKIDKVLGEFADGTTPAGDSNKLGGKGASEYALVADLLKHNVARYRGETADEIGALYASFHTNAKDDDYYKAIISHNVSCDVLGGGVWYLEGVRITSTYGWQKATCYDVNKVIIAYERSINNGVWTGWTKNTNAIDLANYLPLTGGEIISRSKDTTVTFNDAIHNVVRIGFKSNGVHRGYLAQTEVEDGAFRRITPDGTFHNILDTGNKPTGAYTGTGASRIISTNGLGRVCVLYAGDKIALVTMHGAVVFTISAKSTEYYSSGDMQFLDGSLKVPSNAMNVTGATYYYQVV